MDRFYLKTVAELLIIVISFVSIINVRNLEACSIFSLKSPNGTILGKSYDFVFGHGMLITNKRNMKKMAIVINDSYWPREKFKCQE